MAVTELSDDKKDLSYVGENLQKYYNYQKQLY